MRSLLARGSAVYAAMVVSLCGVVPVAQMAQGAVVGFWRLNGDYTTTVNPVLNGVPANSPVFVADVPGPTILDSLGGASPGADTQSVQFNGGNYVTIPFNALLEPASFTIEFFMKAPAQGAYPGIVTKSDTGGGSGPTSWGLGKANDEQAFTRVDTTTNSNQTTRGGGSTGDNRWHHFALTHDAATGVFTVYRDYAQVAQFDPPGVLHYDGASGLRFGLMALGGSFQPYVGLLDEVRFSDTALTPGQFLTIAPMTLQWGAGGAGGSGVWDAMTTPNWYPGSGAANFPWSAPATRTPSDAVFAGAPGAVTIDAAGVTAKSVTFNTPGYTIAGPGKLTLTTPSVVANQDATISAPMAPPAAGLNKSGAAALTLSGPGVSYLQPTTVSAGTLRLSETTNFASPVTLAGGNLELAGSSNWSIDVPVSGSGSVMKTGPNQVTLYNTNTYDGQTIVSQGTLRLGAGAVPTAGLAAWFDAGAGVTTSGANVTAWADRTGQHGATASGSPTLLAGEINGEPAVQVSTSGWLNVTGAFQAKSVYAVFKSPNATFSYYGTPFGVVNYADGRTFIFENGQTYFHSNPYPPGVRKDGVALTSPYNMAPINQYMVLGVDTAFANNVRTYHIGRSDGYTATLNIAEILAYDHVLTSAEENLLGAYLAQKYGLGTAYAGLAQDSIPNGSTVAIAGGATFDLNGANETIGALADYAGGGGTVTNNAAGRPSVLTLAAPGGSTAFSGTVRDGAGPVSLVKAGAGTQVLAGANTYSGTTAVAAGVLQLAGGANRLPAATVLTMGDTAGNTSGKLVLGDAGGAANQSVAGLANAGSGAQSIVGGSSSVSVLTINSAAPFSYRGAIGGAGANENNLAVVKTGPGTQTLSGALSYTGPTTVAGGTLRLADVSGSFASNIDNSATVELSGGTSWSFASGRTLSGAGTYNKTGASWVTLYNAIVTATGQINLLEGRLRNDGNNCNWSGSNANLYIAAGATLDMRADSVKVNALTGAGTILNTYGAGGGATDVLTVASGSFSGTIGGSGDGQFGENRGKTGLAKVGTGTLVFSGGGINYGGDTNVTGGVLRLEATSGFASNINNSATVEFYSASGANWGLAGGRTLAGGGTYVKTGPGRVFLPNVVVTASGQFQVQEGTLSNEWNSANWSGSTASLDVSLGATFDMRADSVTVNVLTGAGAIANSFGGGGTDILTVSSGSFSGTIGGSGNGSTSEGQGRTGLTKVGAGLLILSGANTYTGATTVQGGTLRVNGSIASSVTVHSGGWLDGTGTIGGSVDILAGGGVSAGNSPGHLVVQQTYTQAGTMLAELGGTVQGAAAGGYDWIEVGAQATLGGTVDVDLVGGFYPAIGDSFDILTAGAGITNADLSGVAFDFTGASLVVPATYWKAEIVPWGGAGGPGEALRLTVAVPEPSTLLLAALGFAALGLWGWRRRGGPRP